MLKSKYLFICNIYYIHILMIFFFLAFFVSFIGMDRSWDESKHYEPDYVAVEPRNVVSQI